MHRYTQGKDDNHRRGGEGSSTPPKKGGGSQQHTPSFLGSTLWDKTIPYDPDLKVTLEHMELEDFLSENDVMPLDDQSVQKSLDFLDRCGKDAVNTQHLDSSPPSHSLPSTSFSPNRHLSASSSTFSSPLHTPPSSSPAYNVPSPPLVNANDSPNFSFPIYSNNNNSSPVNPFLSTLANSSTSSPHHSPGNSGHLTDLPNAPNKGSSLSGILKEPCSFYGHPAESSRLSDSSNSNGKPESSHHSSPILNIDACSDLLFANTNLISAKPSVEENPIPKREVLQGVPANLNQDTSYDSSLNDSGRITVHANPGKKITARGKRWSSFTSTARESLKGRASTTFSADESSCIAASRASSIFEIPSTPDQSLIPPVKKRAYNKKNKTATQTPGELKPKLERVDSSPLATETACSSGLQRAGKNRKQYHEASDDSSTGSVGSRGSNCNNTSKTRGPYGQGKRQAAITFAPDTPSPPPSPGCSSPTSSRSSCYSPEPQHEDDDTSAMATYPGRVSFNPRTRRFTGDELKPQPMVKKSRKQYVPTDLKDDKYWARRRKNNVAAKRSRDARRIKENQIALRANFLEDTHQKMSQDLEAAKRTIELLKKRLSKYEAV